MITVGGVLAKASWRVWPPRMPISSSLTILTTCWAGFSAPETSAPLARSLMRAMKARTTGSDTSASSSASRISRAVASMSASVSRPLPRRPASAPVNRSDRDSNTAASLAVRSRCRARPSPGRLGRRTALADSRPVRPFDRRLGSTASLAVEYRRVARSGHDDAERVDHRGTQRRDLGPRDVHPDPFEHRRQHWPAARPGRWCGPPRSADPGAAPSCQSTRGGAGARVDGHRPGWARRLGAADCAASRSRRSSEPMHVQLTVERQDQLLAQQLGGRRRTEMRRHHEGVDRRAPGGCSPTPNAPAASSAPTRRPPWTADRGGRARSSSRCRCVHRRRAPARRARRRLRRQRKVLGIDGVGVRQRFTGHHQPAAPDQITDQRGLPVAPDPRSGGQRVGLGQRVQQFQQHPVAAERVDHRRDGLWGPAGPCGWRYRAATGGSARSSTGCRCPTGHMPSRVPIWVASSAPMTLWSPPRPLPMSWHSAPSTSRSGRATRVVKALARDTVSTRCRSTVQMCTTSRGGRSRTAPHSGNSLPHRPVRSSASTVATAFGPAASITSRSLRACTRPGGAQFRRRLGQPAQRRRRHRQAGGGRRRGHPQDQAGVALGAGIAGKHDLAVELDDTFVQRAAHRPAQRGQIPCAARRYRRFAVPAST